MLGFLDNPADVTHLHHIKSDHVQSAISQIQNAISDNPDKKAVLCIGTGGTLSMSENSEGIRKPDLDAKELLKHVNAQVTDKFQIISLDAFHLDSAQMDYSHVQDLAIAMCAVWNAVAASQKSFAGFLVLHGTDTISYAGATMSLMMGQGLPFSICYTAAQKPIHMPLSDAPGNMQKALLTLDALHSQDMAEVVSVMGEVALLSSSAIKVADNHKNALHSPLHEPIAKFDALEYPIRLAPWLNPRRSQMAFQPTIWQEKHFHTALIRSHLGLNANMISRQIADDHVQAVLLYSYGAGTLHEGLMHKAVEAANAKQCPIFVLSPIDAPYKVIYESAQSAVNAGIIPIYMTLPAALAKIEIALRFYSGDINAMADFMTGNYVGEIPTHPL